jgi:ABC-type antimicrobial peptide transport system permease subunit
VTGTLVTILLTAVLPVMMRSVLGQIKQNSGNAPSAEMSAGIMAVFLTLIIVFMAFFLVLVPIAFVVFYGREDVAETCRRRDPVERWTDRTPLPLLGASVVFFTGALYLLLTAVTLPMFPLFGHYLTGISGSIALLGMAVIDSYLAIAFFRQHPSGWWIAAFVVPVRLISVALTYAKADMMKAYSRMGMSDAQLNVLNSNPMFRGHVLLWWGLISMLLFFGYIIWLKRYFKTPAHSQPEALSAQVV